MTEKTNATQKPWDLSLMPEPTVEEQKKTAYQNIRAYILRETGIDIGPQEEQCKIGRWD